MDIKLGLIAEIPPGEGRTYKVGAEPIAVFHARGGRVFATQAQCPHRGGPLADGLLGGDVVICPLHAWKFDLKTGQPLASASGCSLKTYPVRVDPAGRIVLQMVASGSAGDAAA